MLAIILTARILGIEMGIARGFGAILFSVVIGLIMAFLFRHEEQEKTRKPVLVPEDGAQRPLWQTALFFAVLVGILVFANWAKPAESEGFWYAVFAAKWWMTGLLALALAFMLIVWYQLPWLRVLLVAVGSTGLSLVFAGQPLIAFVFAVVGLSWLTSTDGEQGSAWFAASWGYAKLILPLLLLGVLVAGFLLGRPGHEGIIPSEWIVWAVGDNSLRANFFAAFAGAFMYFATLTEVPIVQGLIGSGMGRGPALALLLAGPALSLPNMLVIRSVLGTKKTLVFVALVIIMATLSGFLFGAIMGD